MQSLRPDRHGHLGWRPAGGFGFARQTAVVPLAAAEIARVAQALPVLFRKPGDDWQAVAVMGPVEGANVHVSCEGKWRAGFVPARLRVYPFRLDGEGGLGLWECYAPEPLAGDGVQPFFEDGALSDRLQQTARFLRAVQVGMGAVHRPLSQLEAAGALTAWTPPGTDAPQSGRRLSGLYAVDAGRLETLDDALVLELFRSGALRWLHAHLDSLHHAGGFKARARTIVAPGIAAPRQVDKIEQVADFLAALAEDLGDTEL